MQPSQVCHFAVVNGKVSLDNASSIAQVRIGGCAKAQDCIFARIGCVSAVHQAQFARANARYLGILHKLADSEECCNAHKKLQLKFASWCLGPPR